MEDPAVVTYPPAQHLLRDLGLVVEQHGDGTGRGTMDLRPGLRHPQGGPLAGVVATLVDVVAGGLAARAAAPGWIATSDLDLLLATGAAATTVAAEARVVRAGRSTVVVAVDLDAGGEPLGVATLAFAVLERRAHNPEVPVTTAARWDLGTAPAVAAVPERAGIRAAGAGTATMAVSGYVRNSLGAVQGGALALLAEQAALAAVPREPHGSRRVTGLYLTYLALARTGPVVATVTATEPHTATDTVEVRDAGAGNRLTTLATVTTVPAGRAPSAGPGTDAGRAGP